MCRAEGGVRATASRPAPEQKAPQLLPVVGQTKASPATLLHPPPRLCGHAGPTLCSLQS